VQLRQAQGAGFVCMLPPLRCPTLLADADGHELVQIKMCGVDCAWWRVAHGRSYAWRPQTCETSAQLSQLPGVDDASLVLGAACHNMQCDILCGTRAAPQDAVRAQAHAHGPPSRARPLLLPRTHYGCCRPRLGPFCTTTTCSACQTGPGDAQRASGAAWTAAWPGVGIPNLSFKVEHCACLLPSMLVLVCSKLRF
jgi:hypothetical protein